MYLTRFESDCGFFAGKRCGRSLFGVKEPEKGEKKKRMKVKKRGNKGLVLVVTISKPRKLNIIKQYSSILQKLKK